MVIRETGWKPLSLDPGHTSSLLSLYLIGKLERNSSRGTGKIPRLKAYVVSQWPESESMIMALNLLRPNFTPPSLVPMFPAPYLHPSRELGQCEGLAGPAAGPTGVPFALLAVEEHGAWESGKRGTGSEFFIRDRKAEEGC